MKLIWWPKIELSFIVNTWDRHKLIKALIWSFDTQEIFIWNFQESEYEISWEWVILKD